MKVVVEFAVYLLFTAIKLGLLESAGTPNRVLTLFPGEQYTWNTASRLCKDNGMRLLKSNTADVWWALRFFSNSKVHWQIVWNDVFEFWTGLHKDEESGEYVWHDCQKLVKPVFWEPGSSGGDRCVSGLPSLVENAFWSKVICSKTLYAICEKQEGYCSFLTYTNQTISVISETIFNNVKSAADCQRRCLDYAEGVECWAVTFENTTGGGVCKSYFGSAFIDVEKYRVNGAGMTLYVKFCFTGVTSKVTHSTSLSNDKFPTDNCETVSHVVQTDSPFASEGWPLSTVIELETPTENLQTSTSKSSTPLTTLLEDVTTFYINMATTTAPSITTASGTSGARTTNEGTTVTTTDLAQQITTTYNGVDNSVSQEKLTTTNIVDRIFDETTMQAKVSVILQDATKPINAVSVPTSEVTTTLLTYSGQSLSSKSPTVTNQARTTLTTHSGQSLLDEPSTLAFTDSESISRSETPGVFATELPSGDTGSFAKSLVSSKIKSAQMTTDTHVTDMGSTLPSSAQASHSLAAGQEPCICYCRGDVTEEQEKSRFLAAIIQDLHVDAKNVSAYHRRFNSVPDERPSAQTIGYLGISMLCVAFGVLLTVDIMTFLTCR